MVKTIIQVVTFAGATPAELFDLYADSKKHAAATGAKAAITAKAGAKFSAWDGYISGKTLSVKPKSRIVQSWRASDWATSDADSTLTLTFRAVKGGAELKMVHAGVPDNRYASLKTGWNDFYWTP